MSDTPRTDIAALGFARILVDHESFTTTELVDANFARQLERELAEAQAQMAVMEAEIFKFSQGGSVGWLIERYSMWGAEWFCAGKNRWTKDASVAIRFPDKASVIEMWSNLQIALGILPKEFPYDQEGLDWVYHYDATEHQWMNGPPLNNDLPPRVKALMELERAAKEYIDTTTNKHERFHNDAWQKFNEVVRDLEKD